MNITTTITEKGQILIPIMVRRLLDLKPFDKLVFSVEEKKLVATPVRKTILDLYGSVKVKGRKPVDFRKLRQKMMKDLANKAAREGWR